MGQSKNTTRTDPDLTVDGAVTVLYYDRSFMVCYALPNLFTGHIVHDQLLPVTTGKFVRSYQIQVQKSHWFLAVWGSVPHTLGPLGPQLNCHLSGNDDSCT